MSHNNSENEPDGELPEFEDLEGGQDDEQTVPCGVCGEERRWGFLEDVTLYDDDSDGYYPDPYRAPVCVACRRHELGVMSDG